VSCDLQRRIPLYGEDRYTRSIGEFVAGTQYEDLPAESTAAVKLHILDALGIGLGAYGTGHPLVSRLIELSVESGGSGPATILGDGRKISAPDAALVNAVMANFLDSSDGHYMGGHINDRLVPVALAVAQQINATGSDFVTAVALGYEVYIHLAYALFESVEPASVTLPYFVALGTLAGVVPAAKLLGLDAEQTAGAMGLACSLQIAAAHYVLSGGHEKDLAAGQEARRALFSTLLARKGVLGSTDILEGDRGFFRALGAEPRGTADLGQEYRITECYVKPYPACRYLHASIEAALNLVHQHGITGSDVESAVVTTNSSSASRNSYQIKSHVNAIFSHAYQVAAVLHDGRVDLPTVWEEKVAQSSFLDLMNRVQVRATPEYDRRHKDKSLSQPPWPAEVKVLTKDGRKYSSIVTSPKGDAANPMTPEDVREKFAKFTEGTLVEARASEIMEVVGRLETLPSVGTLVDLLRVQ
jgi:2-methylcitrate dehydratase PrpD